MINIGDKYQYMPAQGELSTCEVISFENGLVKAKGEIGEIEFTEKDIESGSYVRVVATCNRCVAKINLEKIDTEDGELNLCWYCRRDYR